MTHTCHRAKLCEGPVAWNIWRAQNPEIIPDLRALDFFVLKGRIDAVHGLAPNLVGARLDGADLSDAVLIAADLTAADLRRADLSRAVFDEADFTLANLEGARLHGARLDRALNLTSAQIATCQGDATTILPPDLTPPEHWLNPLKEATAALIASELGANPYSTLPEPMVSPSGVKESVAEMPAVVPQPAVLDPTVLEAVTLEPTEPANLEPATLEPPAFESALLKPMSLKPAEGATASEKRAARLAIFLRAKPQTLDRPVTKEATLHLQDVPLRLVAVNDDIPQKSQPLAVVPQSPLRPLTSTVPVRQTFALYFIVPFAIIITGMLFVLQTISPPAIVPQNRAKETLAKLELSEQGFSGQEIAIESPHDTQSAVKPPKTDPQQTDARKSPARGIVAAEDARRDTALSVVGDSVALSPETPRERVAASNPVVRPIQTETVSDPSPIAIAHAPILATPSSAEPSPAIRANELPVETSALPVTTANREDRAEDRPLETAASSRDYVVSAEKTLKGASEILPWTAKRTSFWNTALRLKKIRATRKAAASKKTPRRQKREFGPEGIPFLSQPCELTPACKSNLAMCSC